MAAEIEITLPTVQYGNVKVRATPEELGADLESPHSLGVALAVFQNLFTQGWKEGSQMDVSIDSAAVTQERSGSTASVSAPQGASQGTPRTISQIMSDEDVDSLSEAQAILDKELGGVTEVPELDEYDSATEAKEAVQASAPWNQQVDAKPKPWETEVTAPAVLDATW